MQRRSNSNENRGPSRRGFPANRDALRPSTVSGRYRNQSYDYTQQGGYDTDNENYNDRYASGSRDYEEDDRNYGDEDDNNNYSYRASSRDYDDDEDDDSDRDDNFPDRNERYSSRRSSSRRGFAAMDPEEQHRIARMGGRASHSGTKSRRSSNSGRRY